MQKQLHATYKGLLTAIWTFKIFYFHGMLVWCYIMATHLSTAIWYTFIHIWVLQNNNRSISQHFFPLKKNQNNYIVELWCWSAQQASSLKCDIYTYILSCIHTAYIGLPLIYLEACVHIWYIHAHLCTDMSLLTPFYKTLSFFNVQWLLTNLSHYMIWIQMLYSSQCISKLLVCIYLSI